MSANDEMCKLHRTNCASTCKQLNENLEKVAEELSVAQLDIVDIKTQLAVGRALKAQHSTNYSTVLSVVAILSTLASTVHALMK